MKKSNYSALFFVLTVMAGFLSSCNTSIESEKKIVEEYFEALDAGNFERARAVVSDTLTISEGDFSTDYSGKAFYEHFRWDSIFQPSYAILELRQEEDGIFAVVSSSSVRYKFLGNDPLSCERRITFKDGKIRKITIGSCPDAKWELWQARRDTLVNWTAENHPDLDGFINDLSMKGAQNYMQAMELYENAAEAVILEVY